MILYHPYSTFYFLAIGQVLSKGFGVGFFNCPVAMFETALFSGIFGVKMRLIDAPT